MTHRFPSLASGLFGATGVVAGAFGAHALRTFLVSRGMQDVWDTAARYQILHAAALLGIAAWMRVEQGPVARARTVWAVRCWTGGIVLFSGSLYLLAAGGPRWLGPVTPLGGAALIAGWLWLAAAAWTNDLG